MKIRPSHISTRATGITRPLTERSELRPPLGGIISNIHFKEGDTVQAGGSFIFSRDKGWKEVKLGRIFKSSDCMDINEKRGWIKHSQYVAHLGDHQTFTRTMDELIESYGALGSRLVFISDGAIWLRNWMTDAFPEATQILDFYHALEYLHEFSNAHFKTNPAKADAWIKKQKELLLASGVKQVLQNIRKLKTTEIEAEEKITLYYQGNIERMDYRRYQQLGCGKIGSGAIESAHKTVIQRRMKQAGQRWTMKGAQNMLNLRVLKETSNGRALLIWPNMDFPTQPEPRQFGMHPFIHLFPKFRKRFFQKMLRFNAGNSSIRFSNKSSSLIWVKG